MPQILSSKIMNRIKLILILLALHPIQILSQNAQKQDTLINHSLKEILVKATRIEGKLNQLPYASSVVEIKLADQFKPQLSLQEFINQIPGLYSQNATNNAQDLRISIRGFGARSAFGIRGIKLIVDGIPETTPDGQGQLDNLNLGLINQIEVIKGASASLYGNASGGVIAIHTKKNFQHPFIDLRSSLGNYDMQKQSITTGFGTDSTKFFLHGAYNSSDSYRKHSRFKQYSFNANISHQINSRYKIDLSLNYLNSPIAQDPGSLTIEEIKVNRRQARNKNLLYKTEESIKQIKTKLALKGKLSKQLHLNAYAFFSYRDFSGKLPFTHGGFISMFRNYSGHGTSLSYKTSINKLKFGYDLAIQSDNRKRFENLEGSKGDITLNQQEEFRNIGIYLLDHFSLNKWNITGGLRFDWNKLKVRDRLLYDGNQSDNLNFRKINPSIRFGYSLVTNHNIFTGFSTSFETPSLSELSANPNGEQGFNTKLKAQTAQSYETGIKGKIKNDLRYQLVFFITKTNNDLVPYELEAFPGRSFFRNAGKTNRKGLEFEMTYLLHDNWKLQASYTLSKLKYKTYKVDDNDFSKNYLPGIPKKLVTSSLQFQSNKGFHANLQINYVGSLFTNDSNTVKTSSYILANLSFGYSRQLKHLIIQPFGGIRNILNKKYNDNIRINAFGQRYYEPAPGTNAYVGIIIKI